MPRRPWFAKAKSVHDLGNWFYVPKAGEYDWERNSRAEGKWIEHFQKEIPVEERYRFYFGSRMHDSFVMGIERNEAVLRIRLSAEAGYLFALDLARVLTMPCPKAVWEVDLLAHDPRYVRAAKSGPDGGLRFTEWTDFRAKSPNEGDSFLFDWFFEEDGRIQWIVQLWKEMSHRRSDYVYLMVDCSRVSAEDRTRAVIEREFGTGGALLWDDAVAGADLERSHLEDGRMVTEEYLRNRIAARGFGAEDFRV